MDDSSFNLRIPKRLVRTALVVVATAMIVAPLTAIASHSFTDVPDSNIFHNDIDWLADAGVTRGCNPPENTEFCPKDVVTRETMAAFLHRLAINEVVNAATAVEAESSVHAQNADHADTADHATTAGNADTVDGKHASAFLGSNDTAVDSDKVDGKHANELTRVALGSNDQPVTLSTTFNTHSTVTIEAPMEGFILLTAGVTIQNDQSDPCPSDCEIMAVIEWVAGGLTEFSVVSQMDAAAGSQQAVPLTWVFPVQAGSQRFDLRVRRFFSSGGTIEAQFSQITALYSPFGASGDPFPILSGEG